MPFDQTGAASEPWIRDLGHECVRVFGPSAISRVGRIVAILAATGDEASAEVWREIGHLAQQELDRVTPQAAD